MVMTMASVIIQANSFLFMSFPFYNSENSQHYLYCTRNLPLALHLRSTNRNEAHFTAFLHLPFRKWTATKYGSGCFMVYHLRHLPVTCCLGQSSKHSAPGALCAKRSNARMGIQVCMQTHLQRRVYGEGVNAFIMGKEVDLHPQPWRCINQE